MKNMISFLDNVARDVSLKAAIIENDLAWLATHHGFMHGKFTTVRVKWGFFDEKFPYMTVFETETDKNGNRHVIDEDCEQGWLCELEEAGIIELDYDDDTEEWIITFDTKYLIERGN